MILEHFKESWTSHLGAMTGTTTSLIGGVSIIQSVFVGVLVYCITKLISIGISSVWSKWK